MFAGETCALEILSQKGSKDQSHSGCSSQRMDSGVSQHHVNITSRRVGDVQQKCDQGPSQPGTSRPRTHATLDYPKNAAKLQDTGNNALLATDRADTCERSKSVYTNGGRSTVPQRTPVSAKRSETTTDPTSELSAKSAGIVKLHNMHICNHTQYDTICKYLTFSQKLTGSQLSL